MASIGGRGLKFKVEVDPKSVSDTLKYIDETKKRVPSEIGKSIDVNTNKMVSQMRRNILRDTGLAMRSTRRTLHRKNGQIVGADVVTDVDYGVFIERMKPYFIPAYNKYVKIIFNDINRVLKKIK